MRLFDVYEKTKTGFKLIDVVRYNSSLTCTNVKYSEWEKHMGKDIWVTFH